MKEELRIMFTSIIGRWFFQILFLFNKINIKGEEHLINLINSGKPVMVCVWHGRLVFPSWYLRLKTTNVHAIASHHTDAEIMARVLKQWGYGLIRGSTKKGGKAVVQKMAEIFNNNGIVAVTNDGPKGPPRIAKAGSTATAIKYNVQVITITGSATKYWQMKSWDRFMVPKPFGKIQVIVSPPLDFYGKLETAKKEVELLSNFMNQYQNEVDRITGKID